LPVKNFDLNNFHINPNSSLSKPWFTYIIRCSNGSLYTGSTNHIIRRWNQHLDGNGAKYLRAHEPREMVYVEKHPTQSDACKREYRIKQLSKKEKEALIKSSSGGNGFQ